MQPAWELPDAVAPEANLLTNPGLADDAADWQLTEVAGTEYQILPATAPGGSRVLQVSVPLASRWGELGQAVPVTPGDYAISVMARAEGARQMSMRIHYKDVFKRVVAPEPGRTFERINSKVSAEWRRVSAIAHAPAGGRGGRS